MIPAAADLYSLPIGEFTAERDRLARRLADEGSKEDAVAVSRLRKPTTDAWALNQVARTRPELIEQLVGVHEELRRAADRHVLRNASERRVRLLEEITAAAASGIARPCVEGFEPPPDPAVQAGPADPAVQAEPADPAVQAEPADPAVLAPKAAESGPAPQPPSTPQEPPSSQDASPPSGAMVAQAPTESRDANRRTGVNAGAAATDPADTESPQDDGVVLAEAGPL